MIFILTGSAHEAEATAAEAGLKWSQWRAVGPVTLRGISSPDHEIWISPCWKHRRGDSARRIGADIEAAFAMGPLGPKYVQIPCLETPYERPV